MVLKLLFNFNDKQTNKSTVKESLMTILKIVLISLLNSIKNDCECLIRLSSCVKASLGDDQDQDHLNKSMSELELEEAGWRNLATEGYEPLEKRR